MKQFLLNEGEEHVIKQYLESFAKNATWYESSDFNSFINSFLISLNPYLRKNLIVYCFNNWYCTLCWWSNMCCTKGSDRYFYWLYYAQVSKYRVFSDPCFPVFELFLRSVFWWNFNWKMKAITMNRGTDITKRFVCFDRANMMSSEKSGVQRHYRNMHLSQYMKATDIILLYYYFSESLTTGVKQLFCGTVDKLII